MTSYALNLGYQGVDVCYVCYTVEAIENILPMSEAELVMIAKTSISKDTSDNAVIIQPLYKH